MKRAVKIIAILIAIAVVLAVVKDVAVGASIVKVLHSVTGLSLRMKAFHIGLLAPLVHVKGLMLYNPETFSDRVMLDVPEIFVVYSLRDISRGDIHFREMRLSLKECVVVKDRYGELNVSSLKFFGNDRGREGPPKAWDVSRMRIDSLRLEIGRAIYKDYSQGATPAVKVFDIDINERFENISDLYALGRLIFLRSLTHTSIPILSNLNVEDLGTAVGVVVGKSGEVLKTTGGLAKDSVTGVGQAIQGVGGLLLNPGEDGKGK